MTHCSICGQSPSYSLKDIEYCIFHLPFAKRTGESFVEDVGKKMSSNDVRNTFIASFKEKIVNFKERNETEFSIEGFIFPEMSLPEWASLWTDLAAEQVKMYSGMIPIKLDCFLKANNTTFYCPVLFKGYFLKGASFSNAKFEERVVFDNVVFKDPTFPNINHQHAATEFDNAIFEKEVRFVWARFFDNVSFCGVEFKGSVEFFAPHFYVKSGQTDINSSDYYSGEFIDTVFRGPLYFRDPLFSPNAQIKFIRTRFSSSAIMKYPSFAEDAELDFSDTEFGDVFKLSDAFAIKRQAFPEKVDNLRRYELLKNNGAFYDWVKDRNNHNIKPRVRIQRGSFSNNGILVFDNIYIDRFSFYKTSLFSEKNRLELPNEPILHTKDFSLYDEKDRECCGETYKFKELERIARELRTALERKGKYVDAGIFFKLEMKYRKKQLRKMKTWMWCLFHELYSWIDYGESIGKAFAALLAIVLLGGAVHLLNGFYINKELVEYYLSTSSFSSELLRDYSYSLIYVIQNIAFSTDKIFDPPTMRRSTELINIALKIFAFLSIAIIGVAIRRKMRRMMVD